jgi:hypothetical protein
MRFKCLLILLSLLFIWNSDRPFLGRRRESQL